MHAFEAGSIDTLYLRVAQALVSEGHVAAPRGVETRELLHVGMTLRNPARRLLTQWGRNLNPFFHLAENLWILGGRADAEWILPFNRRLAQVLDTDGGYFHAPYGERIRHWGRSLQSWVAGDWMGRDQLVDCYTVLQNDPASRQAVMVLWNPGLDHPGVVTKDRPCNDAVFFKVRDGALWMTVCNRSNDLVFGWSTTNVLQFTTLQAVLASWLGVVPGPYTHYADSLHLYTDDPFGGGASPARLAGVEHGRVRAPFRVYEYVDPTPMQPSTPQETTAVVQALLRLFPDDAPTAVRDSIGWPTHDPYWLTTAWALRAWTLRTTPWAALKAVEQVPCAEWKIECLRWLLARWRRTHPGDVPGIVAVCREIVDLMPWRAQFSWTEARTTLYAYVGCSEI